MNKMKSKFFIIYSLLFLLNVGIIDIGIVTASELPEKATITVRPIAQQGPLPNSGIYILDVKGKYKDVKDKLAPGNHTISVVKYRHLPLQWKDKYISNEKVEILCKLFEHKKSPPQLAISELESKKVLEIIQKLHSEFDEEHDYSIPPGEYEISGASIQGIYGIQLVKKGSGNKKDRFVFLHPFVSKSDHIQSFEIVVTNENFMNIIESPASAKNGPATVSLPAPSTPAQTPSVTVTPPETPTVTVTPPETPTVTVTPPETPTVNGKIFWALFNNIVHQWIEHNDTIIIIAVTSFFIILLGIAIYLKRRNTFERYEYMLSFNFEGMSYDIKIRTEDEKQHNIQNSNAINFTDMFGKIVQPIIKYYKIHTFDVTNQSITEKGQQQLNTTVEKLELEKKVNVKISDAIGIQNLPLYDLTNKLLSAYISHNNPEEKREYIQNFLNRLNQEDDTLIFDFVNEDITLYIDRILANSEDDTSKENIIREIVTRINSNYPSEHKTILTNELPYVYVKGDKPFIKTKEIIDEISNFSSFSYKSVIDKTDSIFAKSQPFYENLKSIAAAVCFTNELSIAFNNEKEEEGGQSSFDEAIQLLPEGDFKTGLKLFIESHIENTKYIKDINEVVSDENNNNDRIKIIKGFKNNYEDILNKLEKINSLISPPDNSKEKYTQSSGSNPNRYNDYIDIIAATVGFLNKLSNAFYNEEKMKGGDQSFFLAAIAHIPEGDFKSGLILFIESYSENTKYIRDINEVFPDQNTNNDRIETIRGFKNGYEDILNKLSKIYSQMSPSESSTKKQKQLPESNFKVYNYYIDIINNALALKASTEKAITSISSIMNQAADIKDKPKTALSQNQLQEELKTIKTIIQIVSLLPAYLKEDPLKKATPDKNDKISNFGAIQKIYGNINNKTSKVLIKDIIEKCKEFKHKTSRYQVLNSNLRSFDDLLAEGSPSEINNEIKKIENYANFVNFIQDLMCFDMNPRKIIKFIKKGMEIESEVKIKIEDMPSLIDDIQKVAQEYLYSEFDIGFDLEDKVKLKEFYNKKSNETFLGNKYRKLLKCVDTDFSDIRSISWPTPSGKDFIKDYYDTQIVARIQKMQLIKFKNKNEYSSEMKEVSAIYALVSNLLHWLNLFRLVTYEASKFVQNLNEIEITLRSIAMIFNMRFNSSPFYRIFSNDLDMAESASTDLTTLTRQDEKLLLVFKLLIIDSLDHLMQRSSPKKTFSFLRDIVDQFDGMEQNRAARKTTISQLRKRYYNDIRNFGERNDDDTEINLIPFSLEIKNCGYSSLNAEEDTVIEQQTITIT